LKKLGKFEGQLPMPPFTLQTLSINLTPITNAQHTHQNFLVLDVTDDAPVAHAVFLVTAQALTREGFADVAWVGQAAYACAQKTH
jgi:hypothetical protein